MADHNGRNGRGGDDLDTWLHDRIEPLPPPPGTFEAIRRRARRRKYRRLAVSAGAAVVIVAAAVTVPQVVKLPVEKGAPEAAASNTPRSATPGSTPSAPNVEVSSKAPIPLPQGAPVPPNFRPASVTAVSTTTVFTIGQAGAPGQCATQYCTSVARTQNGGQTWTGLPAPLAGAPDGAAGVGQIRFLEGINGWAFGPELWATHDGGKKWTQIGTNGLRVIDVETVGRRAFAIEGDCTGGGQDFASNCTAFTLYTSPAAADAWTEVGPATTDLGAPQGGAGAASLALTGTRGYLIAPGGAVFAGPTDGSVSWQQVSRIPCAVGQAQADGEPRGALLDAASAKNLVLACTGNASAGTQTKTLYLSSDYGKSWHQKWPGAPTDGIATSITDSLANDTVTLATTTGIDVLNTAAGVWQTASLDGTDAGPAGGFSFVGMTTELRGMALPADPAQGTVWFTTDGGLSWNPSRVRSPA